MKEIKVYGLPVSAYDTHQREGIGVQESQGFMVYVVGKNDHGLRYNAGGTSGSEVRLVTGEEIGVHSATMQAPRVEDYDGYSSEEFEAIKEDFINRNQFLGDSFEQLINSHPEIKQNLEEDYGEINNFRDAVNAGMEFAYFTPKTASTLNAQLKTFDEVFPGGEVVTGDEINKDLFGTLTDNELNSQ